MPSSGLIKAPAAEPRTWLQTQIPSPQGQASFPPTIPRMTVTPVEPKAGPPSTLYQGKKKRIILIFAHIMKQLKKTVASGTAGFRLSASPRNSDSPQCLSPDFASALSGVRQEAGPLGGRMAASSPRRKDFFPPKSLTRIVLSVPGTISVASSGVELPG